MMGMGPPPETKVEGDAAVRAAVGACDESDPSFNPEAVLARELALCYTPLALITDTDAGVEEGEGVTQDEVFRVFGHNVARLRELVKGVIGNLPVDRDCLCSHVLDGVKLPIDLP